MSSLLQAVIVGAIVLALIQGLVFMAAMADDIWRWSNSWEEWMAVPLVGFMLHFHTLAKATLTGVWGH